MVPNDGTDWINSYKSNLDLGGGFNILDIFSDIDSNEGIIRYLAYFNYSLWYICELFILVIELTLFSIEAFSLLPRYAISLTHFWKFYEHTRYWRSYPCFDVILGCLDACLTCLDKMHVVCYIAILTLMSYDSAWEAVQVRTLTLLYCDLIFFGMLFFLNHLSRPRYPQLIN